ncbi:MAG: hypothetical protein M1564_01170 [Candidatus Marsarchaeota archaeon]|jgi:hypothetical protein|nr:hypothetical protein [Candidatus Marsarchaeota archaeon]MCL5430893.1 hypothetical protein [Candidatus Marsarchaeota archaeon]
MAERVGRERIDREDGYLYYLGKDGAVWKSPMRSNPRGRKGKVSSEKVQREEGYLYFIDKNGYVARTKMNRRGRQSKPKAKKASKSMRAKPQKRRRR